MTKITKRDFITAVAKRSNLRKDVVEDVLKAVVDISIEQIVNHGEFVMKDLFSISNKEWKAYSLAGVSIPVQKRLKIRLSEKVKSLWKLKNEVYPDLGDLTRLELEEALKHQNANRAAPKIDRPVTQIPKTSSSPSSSGSLPTRLPFSPSQPKPALKEADDFNPLLDEED